MSKIVASSLNKFPKDIAAAWRKKISKVKIQSDKTAIIFLGEMLAILSEKPVEFSCTGIVDYDMFGGCDFSWTLKAGNLQISRSLSKEISDSWQRVEESSNSIDFQGLEKYNFSWNGECGGYLSDLEINLNLVDNSKMEKILNVGKSLYSDMQLIK